MMKDVKQYFLGENANIVIGIDWPNEPDPYYYDNTPMIKLRSFSPHVMLAVVTDDNTSMRLLMTPKEAKQLGKILSKELKKYAKDIS